MPAFLFTAILSLSALLCFSDSQDPQDRGPMGQMPDLVGALQKSEGCLGVEVARTPSGKQAIFAWFKDKKSVVAWYYSPTHQQIMGAFTAEGSLKKPLEHVEDGTGPIMVIASLTMSEKPQFEGLSLPVSQIAIELYQPLPGGTFLGERFTPKSVPVAHSREILMEKGDGKKLP